MNINQIKIFANEVSKNINKDDLMYEFLYISTKHQGAKLYKKCYYDVMDGWLLIIQQSGATCIELKSEENVVIAPLESEYPAITFCN